MSTWKSLLSTQILNLGNNSESVSIRLIPLPQDLVSVLQSRSTVFYWSIDLTEEIHRYGPRISVICIHLLQMVWHCRWIYHQWAWNKEEFTNLLSKWLLGCWRNTPGALDQKRTIERFANIFCHVASSELQAAYLKGIVHNFFVYRSNLIFWIVMGCGIADFGRRGL